MPDFLLELRSEEIPARMQAGARADLERLFRREMDAAGVGLGNVSIYSTPRRLALIARNLPEKTGARRVELKGPPVGAPDKAIDGFCRKNHIRREDLEVFNVKGRDTYMWVRETEARPTTDFLRVAVPWIVKEFPWPKSMRWGEASVSTESLRWVRPLSGIVAILGEELVECEVGPVQSGYATMGHRFHAPRAITIGGAHDYADKLRACHVIVDHEERQAIVRDGAAKAATDAGLALVEDEGLVIENAGLTEWPVPLLGRFDEEYLEVPPEVIQLTARTNQKYFVCEQDGKLANAFVCTANIEAADDGEAIVAGNRKVLAARLSDARFFWEQDLKKTLAQHAEGLERITFHEKLGTVADKVDRVAKLARWLVEEGVVTDTPLPLAGGAGGGPETSDPAAPTPNPSRKREGDRAGADRLADWAEQAARLCKADLVTEMVGEFPELQGLMGGYYARAEGLPDAVADAIRDHYKPVGQGDDVPTAPVTVAVSLADKLDTLAGFFAIDEKPTGSRDPFALRRAALGILAIIIRANLRLNLFDAIFAVWDRYDEILRKEWIDNPIRKQVELNKAVKRATKDKLNDAIGRQLKSLYVAGFDDLLGSVAHDELFYLRPVEIQNFVVDRLKVQQREAGVRHDLIDAVFALGGEDDLVRLLARVHALQDFIGTEDGANLLAGYKRAANILKKEDWHGPEGEVPRTGEEDPLALVDDPDLQAVIAAKMADRHDKSLSYTPEPAEKALINALDSAGPRAAQAVEREDFTAAMAALASLRAPIDAFFDDVTVNDADERKRANRLGLLDRFRVAVHNVADFSKIEG